MKKRILLIALIIIAATNLKAQQYWIVGGQYAAQGQFPWVADLRFNSQHACGGTLIAPDWILTAAHCVDGLPVNGYSARLNTVNTTGPQNPNGGVTVAADQFYQHPMFNINNTFAGYDIALIKLKQPVLSITPMALVSKNDTNNAYLTNAPVKVAGWGLTDPNSQISPDTMKWANSKVYDFATCKAPPLLPNRMFCIGYKTGETPSGAGAGDSGGPAWRSNNGTDELIGLVSGGELAATAPDTPGYFTKVASFRDWIDGVIGTPVSVKSNKIPDYLIHLGMSEDVLKVYFGNTSEGIYTISLININGAMIQNMKVENPKQINFSLDISSVPTGMYVVRVADESGKQFAKKVFKY